MKRSMMCAILVASVFLMIACGASAEDRPTRLWKDATGKFQIRAALIERTDSTVRLHTEDGREVTVVINRLSQADQDFLKSASTSPDNPFAGGTPLPDRTATGTVPVAAVLPGTLRAAPESKSAGNELALPGTGTTLDLSSDPTDLPFAPDPEPNPPSIPAVSVPVSAVDAYDKVSTPVLADSGESVFFISIGRNKSGSPEETRGRIYTVDLGAKESKLVWDFPQAVRVLDHDQRSGRTLIVDKLDQFQRGGELVLLEGLATGNAQPLLRRTLPGAGKPGFAPQVEWAKLLSSSHAAAIVDRVLYVWDMPAAQLVYRVENVYASEPPVFSGNELYMAIPRGGEVVVIETANGTVRRILSTGSTLKPGAAFHPDGRMLATCFSNQYQVWDCVQDTLVHEAVTTDHLGSHPINWIAPKMFRSQLGDVIQLDLGMSVWKYSLSTSTEPIVIGNKLLVATTSQNCALVSVATPNAAAEQSVRQLMQAGDAAMLVQPGAAVAIAIESSVDGVDRSEIRQALSAAAEKAGWKVNERAPIALVAKIGRGKAEQLRFRNLGGGNRTESTATLTPFTAELEIRRGATVLWKRATENRIPTLLRLEEGETVQDAVKRYEKPDPAFFARLNLPPRIPKPEISEQVGRSTLKDGQWQDISAAAARPRSRRGAR